MRFCLVRFSCGHSGWRYSNMLDVFDSRQRCAHCWQRVDGVFRSEMIHIKGELAAMASTWPW